MTGTSRQPINQYLLRENSAVLWTFPRRGDSFETESTESTGEICGGGSAYSLPISFAARLGRA